MNSNNIHFYKPNKKGTGHACSFWLNKDGSIMSSMIKQASWNDKTGKGTFSANKQNPEKIVYTKLSRIEIAGIIDCLESGRSWSVPHNSPKQFLQINFGPYMRGQEDVDFGKITVSNDKATLTGNLVQSKPTQVGFSFSINKTEQEDSSKKSSFLMWFTFPEGRLLRNQLERFLTATSGIEEEEQGEFQEQKSAQKSEQKTKSDDPLENGDIF